MSRRTTILNERRYGFDIEVVHFGSLFGEEERIEIVLKDDYKREIFTKPFDPIEFKRFGVDRCVRETIADADAKGVLFQYQAYGRHNIGMAQRRQANYGRFSSVTATGPGFIPDPPSFFDYTLNIPSVWK